MKDTSEAETNPGLRPLNAPERRPPTSQASNVQVEFGALTHVGYVRKNNEDHYLVARLGRAFEPLMTNVPEDVLPSQMAEYGYGMLVADGMGGTAAGEVASRMAISLLVNLVLDAARWGRRIDDEEAEAMMERVEGYFSQIHSSLARQAESEPELTGMGTTLTVAYSFCSDLFVAHAGDSRAYLFREGRLQKLTRDHTLAQRLVDRGALPAEALATHRFRHVLTNALGGRSSHIETEIEHFHLADCDRLLLCTDGLSDMLDDDSIMEVLRQVDAPGDACRELVDRALAAGGKDNVTVIAAKYSIGSPADNSRQP